MPYKNIADKRESNRRAKAKALSLGKPWALKLLASKKRAEQARARQYLRRNPPLRFATCVFCGVVFEQPKGVRRTTCSEEHAKKHHNRQPRARSEDYKERRKRARRIKQRFREITETIRATWRADAAKRREADPHKRAKEKRGWARKRNKTRAAEKLIVSSRAAFKGRS